MRERRVGAGLDAMHKGDGHPQVYRGTSLIRNHNPLRPYSRLMHRALWCDPRGGCVFLMSEVRLYFRGGRP